VREDLVGKSQRGDGQAFRELVGPMQTALYNLALRILGDREEARDVVQEALTTGWLSLPQLRRRDTFQSWLYRIAVNLAKNRARAMRRKATAELDDNVVRLSGSDDPEASAIDRENMQRLRSELLKLNVDLRLAVVLRDVNELSYAEIGDVLGIPDGTVRSRISRARSELRRRLNSLGGAAAKGGVET